MEKMLKDKTAIVGISETAFGKSLQPSELELACQAIKAALDDAGIKPSEVDALSSYTMEETLEFEVARNLGMGDITFFSQVGYGGGAGCAAVGHVSMALATGVANVGVVWRARKRSDPRKRVWAQATARITDHWKYSRPWGLLRPVDEVAMFWRRYMHLYGATRDHLANVALACRKHANRNPRAFMHERTLTRDEYMNARWISEPLCLFDNCLESDGALAVVIVRADRAEDCRQPPAYIHAWSQGLTRQHQNMTNYHGDNPMQGAMWAAGNNLWRQSDLRQHDVKVGQIYDAFTPLIPFCLEALGFCQQGEGGPFTDNGAIELGGRLPVNTSGGSLSEAYVHGMNLITEGVKQIRGTSTAQVPNAGVCLVTSAYVVPTSAMLLRR
ncbi:MAG: lipid-transfer protein [Deltaproteobacteria bacterium]|nr:lipid-transfer protein [Deltaproteobacteria bacterium]